MNTENAKQFLKDLNIDNGYVLNNINTDFKLDVLLEKYHQNQISKPKINTDSYLSDLDLSVRAYNCLKAAEIRTFGELILHTENELMSNRNFGIHTLVEIKEMLSIYGFSLKEKRPNINENSLWERNKIIFEEFNNGVTIKELAAKYSLSYTRIRLIIEREKRRLR